MIWGLHRSRRLLKSSSIKRQNWKDLSQIMLLHRPPMAVRLLQPSLLGMPFSKGGSGLLKITPAIDGVVNLEHKLTFDHSVVQDSRGSSAARWTTTHL